jgi:hypothetical protein
MVPPITVYPSVMVGFFSEKSEIAAGPFALDAIQATAGAEGHR